MYPFIFIISMFVLFFLSVPIAFSLGLTSTLAMLYDGKLSMEVVPQRIFIAMNSFPLMAIPFFILAGNLMGIAGISERLVDFGSALVGHLTGGLAMVAIVTSMFFAAISGSGSATTAAIGSILIPAMVARGYKVEYAAANQAVSGALGIIVPPSIAMILYGVAAEVSIGDLFIAGIIPGMLITFSFLVTAFIISKRNNYGGEERKTLKELMIAFKRSVLALVMPIIVLGGIYSGIFTPTEASVVAVVYAFFIGVFVYRKIKIKNLFEALRSSAVMSSIIMIIIGVAGLFAYYLGMNNVPESVFEFINSFVSNKYVFLIIVNIILLIVGMFMDAGAAILILVPLLLGTAVQFDIDPVHFGVIMVSNLAIGLITPPVGIDLFVAQQLTNVSITKIGRAAIPLLLVFALDVLIISFVPPLSTFLPGILE